MSIRPVVLNGMIQRTQDVGNLKQQEDNRPENAAPGHRNDNMKSKYRREDIPCGDIFLSFYNCKL